MPKNLQVNIVTGKDKPTDVHEEYQDICQEWKWTVNSYTNHKNIQLIYKKYKNEIWYWKMRYAYNKKSGGGCKENNLRNRTFRLAKDQNIRNGY